MDGYEGMSKKIYLEDHDDGGWLYDKECIQRAPHQGPAFCVMNASVFSCDNHHPGLARVARATITYGSITKEQWWRGAVG